MLSQWTVSHVYWKVIMNVGIVVFKSLFVGQVISPHHSDHLHNKLSGIEKPHNLILCLRPGTQGRCSREALGRTQGGHWPVNFFQSQMGQPAQGEGRVAQAESVSDPTRTWLKLATALLTNRLAPPWLLSTELICVQLVNTVDYPQSLFKKSCSQARLAGAQIRWKRVCAV